MDTTQPARLADVLRSRVEAMAALPSRHATDPEPAGPVRDVDAWLEGNWRRAIPRRFQAARLLQIAGSAGQEVADALGMWVDIKAERPNLLLFGPIGCGKSHAAVACLRAVHEFGHTVAMWPVTSLIEATSPGAADPHGSLASAVDADVLLLDDLGMERGTEWVAERIYEVVNQRWMDQAPTIVTTNAAPDVLASAVGERVWSRLLDGAVALEMVGYDRRRAR